MINRYSIFNGAKYFSLNGLQNDLDTDFTLGNCSFGAVKLTKNADLDKYKYSSNSKGSDSGLHFHRQMEA